MNPTTTTPRHSMPEAGDRVLVPTPEGNRWAWVIGCDWVNGLVACNLGFGRVAWVKAETILEREEG